MQSKYRDICNALIIDAREDLKAAKVLMEKGIFSKSVFHSQQAVEKFLKSVLALNSIIITDEHKVSDKFSLLFSRFNSLDKVAEEAKYLERHGLKSRYPLFGDPIRPIWIPSEEYKKEDSEKSLKKARFVEEKIINFLKEKYNIQ